MSGAEYRECWRGAKYRKYRSGAEYTRECWRGAEYRAYRRRLEADGQERSGPAWKQAAGEKQEAWDPW
jgi:hypothetical protein